MFSMILPIAIFAHLALSARVTIADSEEYQSQRPCAQNCFGTSVPVSLALDIGCDNSPVTDECICRPDLQAAAVSYLTSCTNKRCEQNALDINKAVSIYESYCTAVGFEKDPTPASTSSGLSASSSTSASTLVTSKSTSAPTTSSSSNNPSMSVTYGNNAAETSPASSTSNRRDGLSTGEIIGVIVGVLAFLATAVGAWFSYKAIKGRK